MFEKKEIIFSETMGVCRVDDIVKLSDNRKDTYEYYLLRSVSDKSKKAYIPVKDHTVRLRRLISQEEAVRIRQSDGFDKMNALLKDEVLYVAGDAPDLPPADKSV